MREIYLLTMGIVTIGKEMYERYQAMGESDATCKKLAVKIQALCSVSDFLYRNKKHLEAISEIKVGHSRSLEAVLQGELQQARDTVIASRTYIHDVIGNQDDHVFLKMLSVKKHQQKFEEFSERLTQHLDQIVDYFSLLKITQLQVELSAVLKQIRTAIPKLEVVIRETVKQAFKDGQEGLERKFDQHSQKMEVKMEEIRNIFLKMNTRSAFTMEELEEKGKASYGQKDYIAARRYYGEAVEKGSARAMSALGAMLASGQGGERDEPGALKLFVQSAEKLYRRGIYNLAQALYRGELGLLVNQTYGLGYYIGAAEQGFPDAATAINKIADNSDQVIEPEAQYLLACVLRDGLSGVPENARKATELLKRAAAQGHGESLSLLSPSDCLQLSLEMMEGKPNEMPAIRCCLQAVAREEKKAEQQLAKLAKTVNSAEAQFALANAYSQGSDGVASSPDLAETLYKKAAAQGHAGAKQALEGDRLSSGQYGQRGGADLFAPGFTDYAESRSVVTSSTAPSMNRSDTTS